MVVLVNRQWLRLTLGVLLLASLLFGNATQILTAQSTPAPGQGLEISPPLVELTADPGQTKAIDLKLRNVTDSPLYIKAQVTDFVAAGEDGTPKLLLEEGEESSFSLKRLVAIIPDVEVAPKESKNISVTIIVPTDASPGGHYGAIRFTSTPLGQPNPAVALSASIGSLVLLTVSGDVKEELNLSEFYTSQKGKKTGLFEYGPVDFSERLQNTGNVHVQPTGKLTVKNMFGSTIAELDINPKQGNVLPDSLRKLDQSLSGQTLLGRYTAELDLRYGENKSLAQSLTFWVVPYKLIGMLLLGLVLLVVIIKLWLRRYRQRILSNNIQTPPSSNFNQPST